MIIATLGLIGALKEHYCLAMTYAILMVVVTLCSTGGITNPRSRDFMWVMLIINVIITVMAFLFARDLRRRSSQHSSQNSAETYPSYPLAHIYSNLNKTCKQYNIQGGKYIFQNYISKSKIFFTNNY